MYIFSMPLYLRSRLYSQVGNYFWPRISKIYFKGKYFMLRVRDKNNDENTYGFETPSRQACKHLWKCCVEHHAFFRLVQVRHRCSPPGWDTCEMSSTMVENASHQPRWAACAKYALCWEASKEPNSTKLLFLSIQVFLSIVQTRGTLLKRK